LQFYFTETNINLSDIVLITCNPVAIIKSYFDVFFLVEILYLLIPVFSPRLQWSVPNFSEPNNRTLVDPLTAENAEVLAFHIHHTREKCVD